MFLCLGHLQPKGPEGQRAENSHKTVSNRGLGQRALESGRTPRDRRGLEGWLLSASQPAPGWLFFFLMFCYSCRL
ncbi:unnamed protein product [Malus baccata var. baccata]